MLRSLELSALLKPGVSLADVVNKVFRLISFGEGQELRETLSSLEERKKAELPSRQSVERVKPKLDMCVLHWRQHAYHHGFECVGSLGMDASEQKQTNYLFTKFEYVALPSGMTIAQRLNAELGKYYHTDVVPVGCLGYGEASFPRKLEVLAHQARMYAGVIDHVNKLRMQVRGVFSDRAGTELKFANCGALHDHLQAEQVLLQAESATGLGESSTYFFPRALGFTDPMHMVWNAFEAAIKSLPEWPSYEERLRGCLAFLGHRGRRQTFLETQVLESSERQLFHGWKFKLVDWKWQYLADMWRRFSAVAPLLLQRLSVEQIRKPVSEGDGRVSALDPGALQAIESALGDQPTFLALTECFNIFAQAVNRQHLWLTGCGCHDYFWTSKCSDAAKARILKPDLGCETCWRNGRRSSELARGHVHRLLADVRQADSAELQRRISKCPPEKRELVIHGLSQMKRSWTEEFGEKLKCVEELPLVLAGLWPQDAGAQPVAKRIVQAWQGVQERGEVQRQHRVTLDFLVPDCMGVLAHHTQLLPLTGDHTDEVALAAKELNFLPSHAQRVEEIHAKLLKFESHPGPHKQNKVLYYYYYYYYYMF